ncbi:hypothetical protein Pmani_012403 [Petrolisthes manimaculis]|uniref:Mutator-like transposase domain-containing protein n=1 Tax=Petrolisthes manimaculis TaxID=1843537 RepID=A0AAE1PZC6_9EUCA|nr:hypothetical protein Pmani_012403 [Petrolisthes manimaculis]
MEHCKFRYTTVVSDGDSKAYATVKKMKPYGEIEIEKEECINHVAKRLGTALRDLVSNIAKQKITLGGKIKGCLTNEKIKKLTKYFNYAIRNGNTVEEMKRNIYATLRHCISTDQKPQHSSCPVGTTYWCFYQRAVAND